MVYSQSHSSIDVVCHTVLYRLNEFQVDESAKYARFGFANNKRFSFSTGRIAIATGNRSRTKN
jgi:hypothetical protein